MYLSGSPQPRERSLQNHLLLSTLFVCLDFPPPLTCTETAHNFSYSVIPKPQIRGWGWWWGKQTWYCIQVKGTGRYQQSSVQVNRVSMEGWHWQPQRRDITRRKRCAVCELDPIISQVLVPWAWWFSGTLKIENMKLLKWKPLPIMDVFFPDSNRIPAQIPCRHHSVLLENLLLMQECDLIEKICLKLWGIIWSTIYFWNDIA